MFLFVLFKVIIEELHCQKQTVQFANQKFKLGFAK